LVISIYSAVRLQKLPFAINYHVIVFRINIVSQRTARQWIINGVLIVVTLSFLGVSIAPLIGGLFAPPTQQAANNPNQNNSEQERIKNQIEGFEAVLKSDPKNQTALIGLVNLRNQLGKVKETIEPLQTLADSFPDQPEYRMILAKTYLELKEPQNTAAEYRKILTTKPGYIPALKNLVSIELTDKRPEAAIGLLQDTLKTAEQCAGFWAISIANKIALMIRSPFTIR
jgi:tetratricopeptide (TPR) repeat protein